jgi:hypothetical protein
MEPHVQLWTHARKLKALAACQHHVSALMSIISKKFIYLFIWIIWANHSKYFLSSYWSSNQYCEPKKASGGTCADANECMVNVGLECTGGICQCTNIDSKYTQQNLLVFTNRLNV